MKKLILLFIFSLLFNYLHSQWDIKLYKVRDFVSLNSSNDQITVLEMDKVGNIWFNLYNSLGGGGMVKFTGKEWISFNNEVFSKMDLSPMINAIAFDLDNSVWVGTDNGLAKFDGINPTGWAIYKSENYQVPDNKITAIAVDDQNFKYIGFSNGFLAVFDGSKWVSFDKYSGKVKINDLKKDLEGNIWIARDGNPGLIKFKDWNFTEFTDLSDIRNIGINPEKPEIYLVSKDQLFILQNDEITEKVLVDPLLNCELYDVAFQQEGPFVSSDKGLLQKVDSRFRLISNTNSSLPILVPQENYNNIPLLYDGVAGLWFSFIYAGMINVLDNYASIGHMDRIVWTIPPPFPDKDSYKFCFGESLTLDAVVDASNYVWNGVRTLDRTITVFDTKTIELQVISNEICLKDTGEVCIESTQATSSAITVDVIAQHVYEDEEIGVVTCDPLINRNLVVWQKTSDKGTEYYNIYKKLSFEDSVYLGSVNYNELTVFTDNTSNPKDESVIYAITTVDTCGDESFLSSVHQTMYLDANPNPVAGNLVDLIWGHYQGINIDWYYIYRGIDSTTMELIDSVVYDSGVVQYQYTDFNSPAYKVYYQVRVKLPEPIILSTGKKAGSGPYSQSMSNLEDNRFLTSVNDLKSTEVVSYPNPFNHSTQIDFENPMNQPYQLIITDMSGKIVKVITDIRDDKVVVLRGDLPQGFYLFELKGDMMYRGKFVIE